MKYIITISIVLLSLYSKGQEGSSQEIYGVFLYEKAYEQLECMLKDSCELSFKEAVFVVENAYLNERLDKEYFELQIQSLISLAEGVKNSRTLLYQGEDRSEIEKYASIFSVICDTLPIQSGDSIVYRNPYSYDFNDVWGNQNWGNMFVSKLLETGKGNCHSLPYLYKILAEELDAKAHLAIAPNHFYIKHHSKTLGWFNTELTSAEFPIDAWLMASGYIHLDAVVNRLYMEALTDKQAIAICLIDLAKGYERRYGVGDGLFLLRCVNTALEHYPNYINALLLKSEMMRKQFFAMMNENHAKHPSEVFQIPEAKLKFDEMEVLIGQIHTLGYRKMPQEMYLEWLASLKEEREKYANKKLSNFK